MLSVIIPMVDSSILLNKAIERITDYFSKNDFLEYELVIVTNGLSLAEYLMINELINTGRNIGFILLTENFGKNSAILAGLRNCIGNVIIIVGDLSEAFIYNLLDLFELILSGYDLAYLNFTNIQNTTYKCKRSKNKNLNCSKLANYYCYAFSRSLANELKKNTNINPFPLELALQLTHNVIIKDVVANLFSLSIPRGKFSSKITNKLEKILTLSIIPLRIASFMGIALGAIGFLLALCSIVYKIIYPVSKVGFISLLAILLCTSGFILIELGVIGEYVGRSYKCINKFPQYFINEKINV
jgi:undecaprenyl-phosphate 4-deoxy-4-formamido-L-arabinose transferase